MNLYTFDGRFIEETFSFPSKFTGIVQYEFGSKYWYLKGRLHRIDGPAQINKNGSKCWWIKGKLHRLDGPAIEYNDGSKEWWVDNKQVTEEQCKLLHSIMKLKGLL